VLLLFYHTLVEVLVKLFVQQTPTILATCWRYYVCSRLFGLLRTVASCATRRNSDICPYSVMPVPFARETNDSFQEPFTIDVPSGWMVSKQRCVLSSLMCVRAHMER